MSKLADDVCAEIRTQFEAAEHFKNLWMQANEELQRHIDAERAWEVAMMKAVGEDGIGSVVDAISGIERQRDELLAGMEVIASGQLPDGDYPNLPTVMFAEEVIAKANGGGS